MIDQRPLDIRYTYIRISSGHRSTLDTQYELENVSGKTSEPWNLAIFTLSSTIEVQNEPSSVVLHGRMGNTIWALCLRYASTGHSSILTTLFFLPFIVILAHSSSSYYAVSRPLSAPISSLKAENSLRASHSRKGAAHVLKGPHPSLSPSLPLDSPFLPTRYWFNSLIKDAILQPINRESY